MIHLDLSTYSLMGPPLSEQLVSLLHTVARELNLVLASNDPVTAFMELIQGVGGGKDVVVLVDEYDKPLTEVLSSSSECFDANLSVLSAFYSVIKSLDRYIRFCFITGVSRFSKVSIFSGINNLKDLSFHPDYSTITGYTKEELGDSFKGWIDECALTLSLEREAFWQLLQRRYNGYRFSSSPATVYNPISVLNCLSDRNFGNYWFETATPPFLLHRMRSERRDPMTYDYYEGAILGMEPTTARQVSTVDLLYQTGYLTIKGVTQGVRRTSYTLGWPNDEVKDSFYESLLREYSGHTLDGAIVLALTESLRENDIARFFSAFNKVLASIPYSLFTDKESYYHSLLHVALQLTGSVVHSEKQVSSGRIDIVCEIEGKIYIFECKLDASAASALEQIKSRGYHLQYGAGVHLVGVSFSSKKRLVIEWKEEVV